MAAYGAASWDDDDEPTPVPPPKSFSSNPSVGSFSTRYAQSSDAGAGRREARRGDGSAPAPYGSGASRSQPSSSSSNYQADRQRERYPGGSTQGREYTHRREDRTSWADDDRRNRRHSPGNHPSTSAQARRRSRSPPTQPSYRGNPDPQTRPRSPPGASRRPDRSGPRLMDDSPPPGPRRSRSNSSSAPSISEGPPPPRSPTISRSSLTLSPTASTPAPFDFCDRDRFAPKAAADATRAYRRPSSGPKRLVPDLSDGEEDVVRPPREDSYEELVTDSDEDDPPRQDTAASAPLVDTSGSDEEMEIEDEEPEPVRQAPVVAQSPSKPRDPKRTVSFDEPEASTAPQSTSTSPLPTNAARDHSRPHPSQPHFSRPPHWTENPRSRDPNSFPPGRQPGAQRFWVPQPPPSTAGVGGPKRLDQLATYLNPSSHRQQQTRQVSPPQLPQWMPGMNGMGSPSVIGAGMASGSVMPTGMGMQMGMGTGFPMMSPPAFMPQAGYFGGMGEIPMVWYNEHGVVLSPEDLAMAAQDVGSMSPPAQDGGRTPGGRTPSRRPSGGMAPRHTHASTHVSLQEYLFDEYPALTADKRAEYTLRLEYVSKLLEGRPSDGRKTLELKDRETMSWYHDKVKQAIKEGKDFDGDRHFVNRETQDLFKTYLSVSERADHRIVIKEIGFFEELKARYLKFPTNSSPKERASREKFVHRNIEPRIALLKDAASLCHPIWANPPHIKEDDPLYLNLQEAKEKQKRLKAAQSMTKDKGKGKAVA